MGQGKRKVIWKDILIHAEKPCIIVLCSPYTPRARLSPYHYVVCIRLQSDYHSISMETRNWGGWSVWCFVLIVNLTGSIITMETVDVCQTFWIRLIVVERASLSWEALFPELGSQTTQRIGLAKQQHSLFSDSCLQMQCYLLLLCPAPTPHPMSHILSNWKTGFILPQWCFLSDNFCHKTKKKNWYSWLENP